MTEKQSRFRETISEGLEQEKIAELLEAYAEEEGRWLCDANNRAQHYRPSRKLQRSIMKKIRATAAPRNAKLKIALLVAVMAIALLAVTASATRSLIGNFFLTFRDEYLSYHDKQENPEQYIVFADIPMPKYLPAGYEQVRQIKLEGAKKFFFSDAHHDITYIVYDTQTALDIDTENALVEQQLWNGVEAYIITKDDQITIFWNHTLELIGPATLREELLRMAQSVSISPADAGDK